MANLYQQPTKVEYSLPYTDGKGERMKVSYNQKDSTIKIGEDDDGILVNKSDLEWLHEVLMDVKRLHEESEKEKTTEIKYDLKYE